MAIEVASNTRHDGILHFVLFPFMAQGHMIPIIDIAKLIAQQNHIVTIITTPLNALRIKPVIYRATSSGLKINVIELNFKYHPTADSTQGYENLDMLPSSKFQGEFAFATCKLQKPLEQVFEELNPRANCLISDYLLPWTLDVCQKFNVPRLVFGITCSLCLLCMDALLRRSKEVNEKVTSNNEFFAIPGLPHKIEVTKSQVPFVDHPKDENTARFRAWIEKTKSESFGMVVNTFEELEPEYVTRYIREREDHHQQKVWCIGPVSLCNRNMLDMAQRGNNASIEGNNILKWLDAQPNDSVVYVCLGSISNLSPLQMKEIGLGLEASGRPFIWVIRESSNMEKLEIWISEDGFEKRNKERGLVIRGWAPQVLILSHPAIGAFLTHCGWNSILEGICAGVPLLTCPMFLDQFMVEKLVVQVIRTGVKVGALTAEEATGNAETVVKKKEDVKNAVEMVMNDGEEGKLIRERAKKFGRLAHLAVENGGSSHKNLNTMIQDRVKCI